MDTRAIAVLTVALLACVWDLRTRRVPNLLTLGGAVAAVGFSLAQNGIGGAGSSAAGWLTATLLFFPFFAVGGMGAGDVKLLGALSAWLGGVTNALYLACFAALAGGVAAFVVMIASRSLSDGFRNLWLLLAFWRTAGLRPFPGLTLDTSRGPRIAYAVPIAVGALTTLWLR